jgi:hypothetical protein
LAPDFKLMVGDSHPLHSTRRLATAGFQPHTRRSRSLDMAPCYRRLDAYPDANRVLLFEQGAR